MQMRGQTGPGKVSQRGSNLKADAAEGAPEESSAGTGGADTITKLSHYATTSSTYLTPGIKSPQPLSPYTNLWTQMFKIRITSLSPSLPPSCLCNNNNYYYNI